MKFKIQAQHTVYITYVVEGKNFKEARDKLYNRELFTTHGLDGKLFGPCVDYADDVEVDWEETEQGYHYDSDPSPSGPLKSPERGWEWETVCEECGSGFHQWDYHCARDEPGSVCEDCAPDEDAQEAV